MSAAVNGVLGGMAAGTFKATAASLWIVYVLPARVPAEDVAVPVRADFVALLVELGGGHPAAGPA